MINQFRPITRMFLPVAGLIFVTIGILMMLERMYHADMSGGGLIAAAIMVLAGCISFGCSGIIDKLEQMRRIDQEFLDRNG